MKPVKPSRINGRVPILSAQEAVNYIPDEARLCILGAGGDILEATTLITVLADKYKQTQTPRNLSIISPTGLGDRGISPLAQEGLVKWALCGHWGQSPRISDLAEQNKIVAYNYPQGVLTQTLRAAAAHQPGIISDIGIGTFVDPRQQGGKLNEVTNEDLIKMVEFDKFLVTSRLMTAPNLACPLTNVHHPVNTKVFVKERYYSAINPALLRNHGISFVCGNSVSPATERRRVFILLFQFSQT